MRFDVDGVQVIGAENTVLWVKKIVDRLFFVNGYLFYFDDTVATVGDDFVQSVFSRLHDKSLFGDDFDLNTDFCLVANDVVIEGKPTYSLSHCSLLENSQEFLELKQGIVDEYNAWLSNNS